MNLSYDFLATHDHEQFVYRYDHKTGLRAMIAVHNTTLGPGLGGTRLWHYDSLEEAAVDVLRLSEGMTYKAAVAGLNLGGGKSVIIADGREDDPTVRAARFEQFGRFVEELGGRYIAAEDVGTQPTDMIQIKRSTNHVVGMPVEKGGSGDPSPMTAFGVYRGILATVEDVLDRDSLEGIRVSIQGLGKVGIVLAQLLLDAGAVVIGTDVSDHALEEARAMGVEVVDTDAIYDVPVDIFAPCALGAVINDITIPRLTCKIIAGSANNQLDEARHGEILHDRGVVFAVDYVINAGGLINVSYEVGGYDEARAREKTAHIYDTIKEMLARSKAEGISTLRAAQQMAEEALRPMPVR
ncbi:MAG: Leu/Phe/Val dehydrogenase [Chloroflexota bacterium]